MPGGTGLDHATLIVYTELVTVDVAEVDLHAGKFAGKPLQKPIHFSSDKLDHARVYGNVFVAIDLNPHTFLCSPPLPGRPKTSWRLDSRLDSMILWRVNLAGVFSRTIPGPRWKATRSPTPAAKTGGATEPPTAP
jgi:hypothetical protein